MTAVVSVVGGVHLRRGQNHSAVIATGKVLAEASSAEPAAPKWAAANVNDPALAAEINTTIKKYSYLQVGVTMISLADSKTVTYGVSNPYVAASVDKLLTASAFLHQVDTGQASLSQKLSDGNTAESDLKALITESDNGAWTALNAYISHTQLATYTASIGLASYDDSRNVIAPEDVARLLYKLYHGDLLKATSQQRLLGYMQQANYRDYIMSAVPSGVKAYHKVGLLDDRLNDAAILDNGETAYVLVIFSKASAGNYDFSDGQTLFRSITTSTTNHLFK